MKKIISIFLCILLILMLVGCGNMSIGLGSFSFNHIHFYDYTNSYCAEVEKWHDNTTGIEVKTDEYGTLFLSEGSYILIGNKSDCPFCSTIE